MSQFSATYLPYTLTLYLADEINTDQDKNILSSVADINAEFHYY